MFQTAGEALAEMLFFFVTGFILALLYEPLRILRFAFRPSRLRVFIEDFLFLSLCGITTFAYILSETEGRIRLVYFISEATGAVLYFFTLGRLAAVFYKAIISFIKKAIYFIFRPVRKIAVRVAQLISSVFVRVAEKTKKMRFIAVKYLKSNIKIMYNKKADKVFEEGETVNVIKANVKTLN